MTEANSIALSKPDLARALNEWMRRYIEEPERFLSEIRMVAQFLRDECAGVDPSYGHEATAYLLQIHYELEAAP